MRALLFLLLIAPLFTAAQINRSATELARETTKNFVVNKIFAGQQYSPFSYGEIKPFKEKDNLDIEWVIEHRFEISRSVSSFDKNKEGVKKLYTFYFMLDKRMKVQRAEAFSRE